MEYINMPKDKTIQEITNNINKTIKNMNEMFERALAFCKVKE